MALQRLDEIESIAERAASDLLSVAEAMNVYIASLQAAVQMTKIAQEENQKDDEPVKVPAQIFKALVDTLPRFGESSTLLVNVAGFHDQVGQRLIRVHENLTSLNEVIAEIVGEPFETKGADDKRPARATRPKPQWADQGDDQGPKDAQGPKEAKGSFKDKPAGQKDAPKRKSPKPTGLAEKALNRDPSLLGPTQDSLEQQEVDGLINNLFKNTEE
jgi:hypothetical protein